MLAMGLPYIAFIMLRYVLSNPNWFYLSSQFSTGNAHSDYPHSQWTMATTAGGMVQVAECLPTRHEALSLIPTTTNFLKEILDFDYHSLLLLGKP
jgi:hypothetical protein